MVLSCVVVFGSIPKRFGILIIMVLSYSFDFIQFFCSLQERYSGAWPFTGVKRSRRTRIKNYKTANDRSVPLIAESR